tara:strand:- start:3851 stop:5173 length:1323 start_codon:yes stop_codon:yes gene_type:complete
MIRKVRSNIKSNEDWSAEIGPKTLLLGPNESGKSRIVEAIQLAVSGGVHGLFLKNSTVKAGNQLSALGATFDKSLYAEVEFDDGTVSRWEMEKGKSPKQTGERYVALPVSGLRAALTGSASSTRKFFASQLVPPIARKELEEALHSDEIDITQPLDEVLPDMGPKQITIDEIIQAISDAGKMKRKAKADVKATTDILSALGNAQEYSAKELDDAWLRLNDSLILGWLKKQYKERPDDAEYKAYVKLLIRNLAGEKSKEYWETLGGSLKTSDEVVQIIQGSTLHQVALALVGRTAGHQNRESAFSILEKALEKYLYEVVQGPLDAYKERVSGYLPKGDEFGYENSPTSFRIFLERNGVRHYALSGSTEARVLAAMAAGLEENGSMVIVDDRMWDAKTLSETLHHLEDCSAQVILMSTISHRGRQRTGWHYVSVAGEDSTDA